MIVLAVNSVIQMNIVYKPCSFEQRTLSRTNGNYICNNNVLSGVVFKNYVIMRKLYSGWRIFLLISFCRAQMSILFLCNVLRDSSLHCMYSEASELIYEKEICTSSSTSFIDYEFLVIIDLLTECIARSIDVLGIRDLYVAFVCKSCFFQRIDDLTNRWFHYISRLH